MSISRPSAAAAGAIDRDGMLAVGERPAELAAVGAVGEPARLSKEVEDLVAPAILLRDSRRAGYAPDGVLGDHLEQGAGVPGRERREDALDVVDGAQRSSGAIVSPCSSSCEW